MTTPRELFLASDAALRSVIDRIPLDALDRPTPAEWSRKPDQTLRDVLAAHAYDEAWIPDLLAGRPYDKASHRGDLLGSDPIRDYDRLNDAATAAASHEPPRDAVAHFSYGDYPLDEGFLHMTAYRGFQAWSIAHFLGLDYHLPAEVVDGMNELLIPHVVQWRGFGIFPPEIDPPDGADAETVLLCRTGFWRP